MAMQSTGLAVFFETFFVTNFFAPDKFLALFCQQSCLIDIKLEITTSSEVRFEVTDEFETTFLKTVTMYSCFYQFSLVYFEAC